MNQLFYTGVCSYCGQVAELPAPCDTEADANNLASQRCSCDIAKAERNLRLSVESAKNCVRELFGAPAADRGFAEVKTQKGMDLMLALVDLAAGGEIDSASIVLSGYCKGTVSRTAKGKIKIKRAETKSAEMEA